MAPLIGATKGNTVCGLRRNRRKQYLNFSATIYCCLELKIDEFWEFLRLSSSSSAFLPLQTELVPHEAFAKQVPAHVLVLLGVESVV